MGILTSNRKLHIHSNKDWINPLAVEKLPKFVVEKVYFSLVSGRGNPATTAVEVGDHVQIGTKLGTYTDWYVPFYSSVSGTVIGIEDRFHSGLGRLVKHLVVENDHKYESVGHLPTIKPESTPSDIVDLIKEAGIVGLGGAGFPTFMKYQGVTNINDLLINAVECEPYLMTDFNAIKVKFEKLIKGIRVLLIASGAKNAYIAIKKNKLTLIETLQTAIKGHPDIHLALVPDQYPLGYERTLIQQVFHKDYNVLPKEVGIVVNNAQTVIAVEEALVEGKFFTDHYYTVAGNGIKSSKIFLLPIGVPVDKIIAHCGGYTSKEITLLAGGPMTSKSLVTDEFSVLPASGGVTVLIKEAYDKQECLRCGTCCRTCPLGLYPVEIMRATETKNEPRLRKLDVMKCCECGLCSYVCPSKIEVTEAIKRAKSIIRLADRKLEAKNAPKPVAPNQERKSA